MLGARSVSEWCSLSTEASARTGGPVQDEVRAGDGGRAHQAPQLATPLRRLCIAGQQRSSSSHAAPCLSKHLKVHKLNTAPERAIPTAP